MGRRSISVAAGRGDSRAEPGDEAALIARSRAGDHEAYGQLFRLHKDRIYGLALRLTEDPGLAEEVALQAFTAAWTGLPDFRGESRFSTWVGSIAVNCARQELRRRIRRRNRVEPLGSVEHSAASAAPARVDDAVDLERAIARLPAGARQALLLRHVYGFSCREAAEAMRVTTGTVKSQTSRALTLLKEKLSHE